MADGWASVPLGYNEKEDPSQSTSSNKSYECPICLDYLLPPIYQCYSGHMLCEKCESQISICPICRDHLLKEKKIRNRILEGMLEGSSFACRNAEQGCLDVLLYNDLNSHTWDCQFEKLPICSHLGINCDAKQTLTSAMYHLTTIHGLRGFNFDSSECVSTNVNGNGNHSPDECISFPLIEVTQSLVVSKLVRSNARAPTWTPQYFVFKGQLFFLTTIYEVNEKRVMWTVSSLASSSISNQFVARIKLMPRNSGVTFLEWVGPVAELRNKNGNSSNGNTAEPEPNINSSSKLSVSIKTLSSLCMSHELDEHNLTGGVANDDVTEIKWRLQLHFAQRPSQNASNFCWNEKLSAAVLRM